MSGLEQPHRQTIFTLIEDTFRDSAASRARVVLEKARALLDAAQDRHYLVTLASLPLVPALLPPLAVTRVVEGLQAVRRRTRLRSEVKRAQKLLDQIEQLHRPSRVRADPLYRENPVLEVVRSAPRELSFLFTEAESAVAIRYSVTSPLVYQPGRMLHGVALVALGGQRACLVLGLCSEGRDQIVEAVFARTRETMGRCLPRLLSTEYWNWNRGDFRSLEVS